MTRGTVPPPETVIANLRASNAALREALKDRPSPWSFWRGVLAGALVTAALGYALPAFADTVSISGTPVTLQPSTEPGAVAEVVMENISMNGPEDDGEYTLNLGEISVIAVFLWEADPVTGADRITVIAPGYICEPRNCEMTVTEGGTGRVLLMPWEGM